jgi:hypothetical protein
MKKVERSNVLTNRSIPIAFLKRRDEPPTTDNAATHVLLVATNDLPASQHTELTNAFSDEANKLCQVITLEHAQGYWQAANLIAFIREAEVI